MQASQCWKHQIHLSSQSSTAHLSSYHCVQLNVSKLFEAQVIFNFWEYKQLHQSLPTGIHRVLRKHDTCTKQQVVRIFDVSPIQTDLVHRLARRYHLKRSIWLGFSIPKKGVVYQSYDRRHRIVRGEVGSVEHFLQLRDRCLRIYHLTFPFLSWIFDFWREECFPGSSEVPYLPDRCFLSVVPRGVDFWGTRDVRACVGVFWTSLWLI